MYDIQVETKRPSREAQEAVGSAIENILEYCPDSLHDRVKKYAGNHRARIAFDIDYVLKNCARDARLLDCGAWPFICSVALKRLGFSVDSIDIGSEPMDAVVQKLEISLVISNIETSPIPFADGHYDGVLLNEVFEHLRIDLVHSMTEIKRVLADDGVFFLSTPNLRSVAGIKNLLLRNDPFTSIPFRYDQWDKVRSLGKMGHVREYTYTELCRFLSDVGYSKFSVVMRGRNRGRLGFIDLVAPKLRPRFSILARK